MLHDLFQIQHGVKVLLTAAYLLATLVSNPVLGKLPITSYPALTAGLLPVGLSSTVTKSTSAPLRTGCPSLAVVVPRRTCCHAIIGAVVCIHTTASTL
jgi:hypothetical protein